MTFNDMVKTQRDKSSNIEKKRPPVYDGSLDVSNDIYYNRSEYMQTFYRLSDRLKGIKEQFETMEVDTIFRMNAYELMMAIENIESGIFDVEQALRPIDEWDGFRV